MSNSGCYTCTKAIPFNLVNWILEFMLTKYMSSLFSRTSQNFNVRHQWFVYNIKQFKKKKNRSQFVIKIEQTSNKMRPSMFSSFRYTIWNCVCVFFDSISIYVICLRFSLWSSFLFFILYRSKMTENSLYFSCSYKINTMQKIKIKINPVTWSMGLSLI